MIMQDDLVIDPLTVLRCDKRVFKCAAILEVVLYMVRGCLAASRTQLTRHIQDNPIVTTPINSAAAGHTVTNDMEREELKNALIATQESAAVQVWSLTRFYSFNFLQSSISIVKMCVKCFT